MWAQVSHGSRSATVAAARDADDPEAKRWCSSGPTMGKADAERGGDLRGEKGAGEK